MNFRDRDLNEKAFIDGYCVSTVALSIEHDGGMWYETYIFPAADGEITDWIEVWGVRYATRGEAVAGHADVCEKLRAGELETWDGEVLNPTATASQPPPEEGDGGTSGREGEAA